MDYHVILIENGKPTHRWLYVYIDDAVAQLKRLLKSYEEVNEVTATIIKAGSEGMHSTCSELILNQIERPNFDL